MFRTNQVLLVLLVNIGLALPLKDDFYSYCNSPQNCEAEEEPDDEALLGNVMLLQTGLKAPLRKSAQNALTLSEPADETLLSEKTHEDQSGKSLEQLEAGISRFQANLDSIARRVEPSDELHTSEMSSLQDDSQVHHSALEKLEGDIRQFEVRVARLQHFAQTKRLNDANIDSNPFLEKELAAFQLSVNSVDKKADAHKEQIAVNEPWVAIPFVATYGAFRSFFDYLGDLFLHPQTFAWIQLLVVTVTLLGVIGGTIQVKTRQSLTPFCNECPFTMGLLVAIASIIVSGIFCSPVIPWLLILVSAWVNSLTSAPTHKSETTTTNGSITTQDQHI